jgi:DNA-binding response OmpR family regulator
MGAGGQRILVVGSSSPWLEGVVDLLQLAGYDVALSSDWATAEQGIQEDPPDLAILDLSDRIDSLQLPQEVDALAPAGGPPILLLNSTGDDRIWHLERVGNPGRGRVDLYAHSLFGPSALLEKVESCLAS